MPEDLSKIFPDDMASIVEQEPSALVLRLSALVSDALRAIPKLDEMNKTEMIQTIYAPATQMLGFLEKKKSPRQGWTFRVQYLEERFDRKYRRKAFGKKGS